MQLSSESSLQNDNSVYSSQTITNSRMAPGMQDLKNGNEVSSLSYGIPETYQSQQQPASFQKSSNVSSFHPSAGSNSTYNSSTYGASTPVSTTGGGEWWQRSRKGDERVFFVDHDDRKQRIFWSTATIAAAATAVTNQRNRYRVYDELDVVFGI